MTDYLGEFEHLVLVAIVQLREEAYGVTIRRLIEERAERTVSFGAVYSTLRRLRNKGFVDMLGVDHSSDPQGGRPRQVVRITASGRETLQAARRRMGRMYEGLEAGL